MTINGLLALLIGAFALFDSQTLLVSLSMYFGLLVLIAGLLLLIGAYDSHRKQKKYELLLIEGAAMSVVGLLILIFPLSTLKLFLLLIGVWALLTGLIKVYVPVSLGSGFAYRNVMLISGLLFSALGLALLVNPEWIVTHLLIIMGVVLIIIGILTIYFSFMIKNAKE